MKPAFDPTLYLVTDPDLGRGRPLEAIVEAAVRGGATLVQLRDKGAGGGALLEQALALKRLLLPLGVSLIINDRVDVAAAAGLGCHLGQTDLPARAARSILGPDALLGLSLDAVEQAAAADPDLLDYLAFGPFAGTTTKADAGPAVGAARLAEVRKRTHLPLVAIGGIGRGNTGEAIAAGADGVAVVSAIVAADDPEAAARSIRNAIDDARNRKGAA
ncbi:MAG TPA: thiamine phosphate synthase [Geminicoccaceae bacterium]